MIYLDNAATSFIKPPQVAQAVYDSFFKIGNGGRGAHEPTLNASRVIFDTRKQLAKLFNVSDLSRIAFSLNDTESLNIAVTGLVKTPTKDSPSASYTIAAVSDHNSVLRPLYRKQDQGAHFTLLKADEFGRIQPEELEAVMTANDKAMEESEEEKLPQILVIGHASNLTGNAIDVKKFASIVHSHGGIIVIDAAQSAGELPIDVQDMGIDVLCFTGHKALFGPQGTGGIYVRPGLELPAFKVGGSGVHSYDTHQPLMMPTVLEAGTHNGHGLAGLDAGVSFILETGVDVIHQRGSYLAKMLADGVKDIPGVKLYGDYDASLRAPIVTLNIYDVSSGEVSDILWEDYQICTRGGAHCAPLMHMSLGTQEQGAVRFSLSYFNTEEEVKTAIEAIRTIAADAAENQ